MRKKIFCIVMLTVLCVSICGLHYINKVEKVEVEDLKQNTNKAEFKDETYKTLSRLNNTKECSQEFMDNYFSQMAEIGKEYSQDNILIVISENGVSDSYGASKVVEGPSHQYFLAYDTDVKKDDAYINLRNDKSILDVCKNDEVILEAVQYDSWGVEATGLGTALQNANTNILEDVTVAVIDSGCDIDLMDKYYPGKIEDMYNIVDDSYDDMYDNYGHGTHVTGIIADSTLDNVKIIPLKAGDDGSMRLASIIEALNFALYEYSVDVINMSFGISNPSSALKQKIIEVYNEDIICVAASGNESTSEVRYPAGFDEVISIGSVDSQLNISSFSNYGQTLAFVAPGSKIKSLMGDDTTLSKKSDGDPDHETISGTSMATPHAASAVALLKSYNPDLTFENVMELLQLTAKDLGDEGWDKYYGYGLISFENVEFREDNNKSERYYGVFKDSADKIKTVKLKEIQFTPYNYNSITNILGSTIQVQYFNGTSTEILLNDLPDLEVEGYDPTQTGEQTVTIKSGTISAQIKLTNPESYTCGWEFVETNDEIELTGYKNHGLNITKLYVPETINSKNVVGFADNSNFGQIEEWGNYTELNLPSTFKRIGEKALYQTSIEKIQGSTSGVVIGKNGVAYSSVTDFLVPITLVETSGFEHSLNLKKVTLTGVNNEVEINDLAFADCSVLSEVTNANTQTLYVSLVGNSAFRNCVALKNFEIVPNGKIDKLGFVYCNNLSNINLKSVKEIEDHAFYCSGVSEVELSETCENVYISAFEGCAKLTKVKNLSGSIGTKAFYNTGVKQISLGNTIENIADDAFAYCPMESSIEEISNEKYETTNAGIVEKATNKLVVGFTKYGQTTLSNVDIPSNVVEIGNYAFAGNPNLEKITIPTTVQKIGEHAFEDCQNLKTAILYGTNVEVGENAFKKGNVQIPNLEIYAYKDSVTKQNCTKTNHVVKHIDPDEVEIVQDENVYEVGSVIDTSKMQVRLTYVEQTGNREEDVTQLTIQYQNPESNEICQGDKYVTLVYENAIGYVGTKQIQLPSVEPEKVAKPTNPTTQYVYTGNEIVFEIPNLDEEKMTVTNKTGVNAGTYVIVISLKDGYVWEDETVEDVEVVATIGKAQLEVSDLTQDIQLVFDGQSHKIEVNVTATTSCVVKYMDLNGEYTLDEVPSYTEIGSYVVKYVVVYDDNYTQYFGEKTLTITEPGSIEYVAKDVETGYDGNEHTIQIEVQTPDCEIMYSLDNIDFNLTEAPMFKEVGEYVVYYKISAQGFTEVTGSNKVKILGITNTAENPKVELRKDVVLVKNMETDFEKLKENLEVLGNNVTCEHLDKNGNVVNSKIKSGDKVRLYINGEFEMEYVLGVLGDLNGDGKVNNKDWNLMYKYVNGTGQFETWAEQCADLSGDGNVNNKDWNRMFSHLNGTRPLW